MIAIKEKDVFLCDFRALIIFLIPALITNKKIFFYLIGGSPLSKYFNFILSKFIYRTYSISIELAESLGIKKYELLPNGINASNFLKTRLTTSNSNKFVFIGTLTQNKGLHRAVIALQNQKDTFWSLNVYGLFLKDDAYEEYFLNLIRGDERIKLNGFCKDVTKELNKYSTLIFSSVREDTIIIKNKETRSFSSEGSPTVIIEAILSGLKVIANNVTGVTELSQMLPNIYAFDWDNQIIKGGQPDLIKISQELIIEEVTEKHQDLFDQNLIYRKFLTNLHRG